MPFFGTATAPPPATTVAPPTLPSSYWIGDAAGNVVLSLSDNAAVITSQIDFGFPAVRTVSTNRTSANGASDTTRFFGNRTVTWTGSVLGTIAQRSAFLQALGGVCDPGSRPYLYAQRPGWSQTRRMMLRADSVTAPLVVEQQAQVTWIVPDGTIESAALSQQIVAEDGVTGTDATSIVIVSDTTPVSDSTPVSDAVTGGFSFPVAFPVTFSPVGGGTQNSPLSSTKVVSAGTVATPPVIRVFGPVTSPAVFCVSTGAELSYPGLSLAAGESLVIDCAAKTSLRGGDPNAPQNFDFTVFTGWPLVPPGSSQWQTTFGSVGVGFQTVVEWRDRWL